MKDIALQMFSLKPVVLEQGLKEGLRLAADMGYTGVEFAGFFDNDIQAVKCWLSEFGLLAVGSHHTLAVLDDPAQFEQVLRWANALGLRQIACSSGVGNDSRDTVLRCAEALGRIGKTLSGYGITLSYHNHYSELKRLDGEAALDLLYKNTDPAFLKAELDLRWIAYAGDDPFAYIRKYAGRIPLIHLRQMLSDEQHSDGAADEGVIDLREAIKLAKSCGTEQFIYENGTQNVESVARSARWFRALPD